MKNRHIQYWIIGLTKHLTKTILSNLVIFLLIWNIFKTVYRDVAAQIQIHLFMLQSTTINRAYIIHQKCLFC